MNEQEYVVLAPITKNAVQGNVTISEYYKPGDLITLGEQSAALHLQRGNVAPAIKAVQEDEPVFDDLWAVPESDGEEE